MKPRVMLTRPKRVYSDQGKPGTAEPEKTAEDVGVDEEKGGRKGGFNYPSIEGVIIKPLPARAGGQEKKKGGAEAVLALALALGPEDRKTLLAQLSLDQQAKKPADRELEMWALGVQTALVATSGGEAGAAYGVLLLKRVLGPSSCWDPVTDFMARAGFSSLEVSKRQGVYILLAELLVKYAAAVSRKVQAPLTAKFVANNAQHLAAVFDNAFPGYVASGLAPIVAARLTGPR